MRLKEVISDEYWKLAAIDVISSSGVPESERMRLTDSLIQNEEVRRYLLSCAQKLPLWAHMNNDAYLLFHPN